MLAMVFSYNISSYGSDDNGVNLSEKRVLFLSAYSPSFETFFKQVEGIKSVLDESRVTLDIEFLDSKRFYTDENYENFYKSLKYKIDNTGTYDVVIVGDDNALIFVTENKELFPQVPVVFLGINDRNLADELSRDTNITGIYETVSISGTIDLAKVLIPDAKRVVALVDNTVTAQAVKQQYRAISKNYSQLVFDEIDLSDMNYETFQSKLLTLSDTDIVLMIAVHRDITGESVTFRQGLELVFQSTNQPVFSLYDFGLNEGLLGGEVVSFYEQGKKAAEITLEILNGRAIKDVLPIENTHVKILDYALIEKYNLDESGLPKDVEFINRKESFFIKILPYLLASLVIIVLQGVLIFFLFTNIRTRKHAEKEILRKKQDLISSNDELTILNEEILASNEELTMSNQKLFEAVAKIDEQKHEIFDLVYLDDLSKLKNRLAISELIDDWLDHSEDENIYGVLFLDVDNFKLINDTFGHDFGDEIIIATGHRLATLENENTQIGRFGGDEFLIIFKDKTIDKLSEFLYKVEAVFKNPFSIENRSLFLTISVGVSIFPLHGMASKELIKKADMALYEAKKFGKNRSIIFNQGMIDDLEGKVLFQSYIRKAFNNKEFHMNYQPHFDLEKGRFTGAEALIRWHSPDLGFVSPVDLIQASEEMGLIVDIGRWVLEEACLFAKVINHKIKEDVVIAINISSVQMLHPSFLEDLKTIVEKTGVDPKNICLEMTETTLFEYPEGNEHILDKIKMMGIEIALDDFGTGYSSLNYFKNLPASIIKIDKVFIDNLVNNEFDKYTVEMIINLAHHKDLVVIAEGVESQEQMELLKEMACDIIQGYYYSKPLMGSDAIKVLLKNAPN